MIIKGDWIIDSHLQISFCTWPVSHSRWPKYEAGEWNAMQESVVLFVFFFFPHAQWHWCMSSSTSWLDQSTLRVNGERLMEASWREYGAFGGLYGTYDYAFDRSNAHAAYYTITGLALFPLRLFIRAPSKCTVCIRGNENGCESTTNHDKLTVFLVSSWRWVTPLLFCYWYVYYHPSAVKFHSGCIVMGIITFIPYNTFIHSFFYTSYSLWFRGQLNIIPAPVTPRHHQSMAGLIQR